MEMARAAELLTMVHLDGQIVRLALVATNSSLRQRVTLLHGRDNGVVIPALWANARIQYPILFMSVHLKFSYHAFFSQARG